MTSTLTPSFSRSGRSGSNGKQTVRISTDVSEALLCDLADLSNAQNETAAGPVSDMNWSTQR